MKISKELLDNVADGDLQIKLVAIDYSTSIREVVTVGYMMEQQQDN